MDGCSTRSGPFSLSRRDGLLGQARTDRNRLWWYRLGMGGFRSKTIGSFYFLPPPYHSIGPIRIVGQLEGGGGSILSEAGSDGRSNLIVG